MNAPHRREGWLDQVKRASLIEVLALLGIELQGRGDKAGPCPSCGAVSRSSKGRPRPPLNLTETEWHCHRCHIGGDAIHAVALAQTSEGLSKANAEQVRRWFADVGLCDPPTDYLPDIRKQEVAAERRREAARRAEATRADRDEKPWPPVSELAALWKASRPVCDLPLSAGPQTTDEAMADLMGACGLDAAALDPEILAALTDEPEGAELGIAADVRDTWPGWWLHNRKLNWAWPDTCLRLTPLDYDWPSPWWGPGKGQHFRLIAPAYEIETGRMRSIHGRLVPGYDANGRLACPSCGMSLQKLPKPGTRCACGFEALPKTIWPYGCRVQGLILANDEGRQVLRGDPPADLSEVWIAEGMTCWMAATRNAWWLQKHHPRRYRRRAVFGGVSGSFKALGALHERVPQGVPIYVMTDPDKTGDRYANEVEAALPHRTIYRATEFGQ